MNQQDTMTRQREEALLLEWIADLTETDGQALLEENQRLSQQVPFPAPVDFACRRQIRQYFIRRRFVRLMRQSAACLLALLLLGSTCLAVNAGIKLVVQHWRPATNLSERYQFSTLTIDQSLEEYALGTVPEGYSCTISNLGESRHLKLYTGDGAVIILEYWQMIQEESFAVTHPVRDGQTQAGVVDINGLPGTCYRSSNASRPLQVVWLDYEQKIVFLLTGSMSCEELVTLAETVSPVN